MTVGADARGDVAVLRYQEVPRSCCRDSKKKKGIPRVRGAKSGTIKLSSAARLYDAVKAL